MGRPAAGLAGHFAADRPRRPTLPTRVDKAVQTATTAAGSGHVYPRQLRHTLVTQAINRGMSLEAVAALPGHHNLSITRAASASPDWTMAEEYFAVTEKIEALNEDATHAHGQHAVLPADAAGQNMRALRNETVKRLLGNGYCEASSPIISGRRPTRPNVTPMCLP